MNTSKLIIAASALCIVWNTSCSSNFIDYSKINGENVNDLVKKFDPSSNKKAPKVDKDPEEIQDFNLTLYRHLWSLKKDNNFALSTLKKLEVKKSDAVENIYGVSYLSNLETLNIESVNLDIKSKAEISKLNKLKILKISNANLNDLDFIENLNQLETLELVNLKNFNGDLSNISSLKKLQTLVVKNCNLTELEGFDFPLSLQNVDFSSNPKLSNINALKSLENVTELNLADAFMSVESLKNLKKLETLSIEICFNANYSIINSLPRLTKLVNKKNIVPKTDYKSLRFYSLKLLNRKVADELSHLLKDDNSFDTTTNLFFEGFTLRNFHCLRFFTNLKKLSFDKMTLDFDRMEPDQFRSLNKLEKLEIIKCKINNHYHLSSFFEFLGNLTHLSLKSSRLENKSLKISSMKMLEVLELSEVYTAERWNEAIRPNLYRWCIFLEFPDSFPNLKKIDIRSERSISRYNNTKVKGSFPLNIPKIEEINFSKLSFSRLKDIPKKQKEDSKLESLQILNVKGCKLSSDNKKRLASYLPSDVKTDSKTINKLIK